MANSTSRRRFLWALGALGAGTALSSYALAETPELASATRTGKALGAEVAMTALHADKAVAQKAVDAAFDELAAVEGLMSLYRPDSAICTLNRTGRLADPHPYLVEVLRKSQHISQLSDGAFDITVQPLWQLYAEAKKQGKLPDESAIAAARARVDYRRVEISERLVRFKSGGMAITLNAIAQGYAADRAIAAMRKLGIEHALVNTGEIGTIGRRADGKPWSVGIQHPRRSDAYIALASLDGRCMATSGDYATSFTSDFLYNHIFDPATGRSPREVCSVSVVADSGADADALATAVFVLGREKGLRLIERLARTEAMLVFKDGRAIATRGFPTG